MIFNSHGWKRLGNHDGAVYSASVGHETRSIVLSDDDLIGDGRKLEDLINSAIASVTSQLKEWVAAWERVAAPEEWWIT